MSAEWSLVIAFAFMFFFIFLNLPIAWSLLLSGLAGYFALGMLKEGLGVLSYTVWSVGGMESLLCIPLYLVMGQMLIASGLISKLFQLVMSVMWLLRLKGGLAIAIVVANAFFGAISGSIAAAISSFTPIVMSEGKKYGYNKNFLGATLATSGSLASLVPPSINLIIFGFLTETSIASLFMAGIIPGILLALLYSITVTIMVTLNPSLAPQKFVSQVSWREIGKLSIFNIPALIIIFLVLGGIYLGWFTTTESAGAGAAMVFLMSFALRKLKLDDIKKSFLMAGRTMGMILFIFIGSGVLSSFVAISQVATRTSEYIVNLGLSPHLFVLCLFLLYFILGMPLGSLEMMVLTFPIIFPIVLKMGFDPLWFGVFMNLVVEIALASPPVAINIFLVEGIAEDREVNQIKMYLFSIPFVVACILLILLITIFPQLCTWLPNTVLKI